MKPVVTTPFKPQINLNLLPKPQYSSLPLMIPIRCMKPSNADAPKPPSTPSITTSNAHHIHIIEHPNPSQTEREFQFPRASRVLTVGAISALGFVLVMMGMDDHYNNAIALGLPEGPLMEEEFWDNVRRYALYALTVSTGALYTMFQPIVELLKNPVSAVLVLLVFGASFYVVSQVLYAMVGVSDFSYDYSY